MKTFKVFLPLLIVYWLSASLYPTGIADSDELITVGHFFSVAHPPGYGLQSLIIGIFQRILFFVSPAYASNLLAGLLQALALTFIFLSVKHIQNYCFPKSDALVRENGAALGVIITGLSGLYWLYGSLIEVMSLGNLFTALTLYGATRWVTSDKASSSKVILGTGVAWGLGIAHLQPLILLGPGLFYLALRFHHTYKQILLFLGFTLLSFFIGSLIILPLNAHQASYTWDFPQSISGYWKMVSRKDYQGFILEKNQQVTNSYTGGISLDQLKSTQKYFGSLWNQFAGIWLIIALIGMVLFFKKNQKLALGYLAMFLVAGIAFGIFVTYPESLQSRPEYRLMTGTAERQYLLGLTLLALFSGLGAAEALIFLRSQVTHPRFKQGITILFLILPPISLITANYHMGYQRNNRTSYDYNRDMLFSAKPNSAIICTSDIACYGLFYQSLVEHIRPDVVVLNKTPRGRHNFLVANPDYIGFEYPENPLFYAQEIAWNVAKRPTYSTSIDAYYLKYLGLEGDPFYLVPEGLLYKIEKGYPSLTDKPFQSQYLNQVLRLNIDDRNFLAQGMIDYLSSNLVVNAQLFTKYGLRTAAIDTLDYALSLNNQDPQIFEWRMKFEEYMKLAHYDPANPVKDPKETDYDRARKDAYANPTSIPALQKLKTLYQSGNYQSYANLIDQHIKTLSSSSAPQTN